MNTSSSVRATFCGADALAFGWSQEHTKILRTAQIDTGDFARETTKKIIFINRFRTVTPGNQEVVQLNVQMINVGPMQLREKLAETVNHVQDDGFGNHAGSWTLPEDMMY